MTFDLRKIHETEKIKSVNFLEIRILKIEKKKLIFKMTKKREIEKKIGYLFKIVKIMVWKNNVRKLLEKEN